MTLEPLVAPGEAADGGRRRALLTSHPVLAKDGLIRLERGAVVLERPGDLAELVDG